jgi:rRNA maturation RNase YbeY
MDSAISYNAENISFSLKNKKTISEWITNIVTLSGNKLGAVSYIFCDDEYLYQLNKKYLKHDTYTDIITFDYSENSVISGDIFISIERVKENAKKYNKTVSNELLRVICHGMLHLVGFSDSSPAEKTDMTEAENEALKLLQNLKNVSRET